MVARWLFAGEACAETEPLVKACLLNMSICHFQLGQLGDCVDACTELLSLEHHEYKALFRRGVVSQTVPPQVLLANGSCLETGARKRVAHSFKTLLCGRY